MPKYPRQQNGLFGLDSTAFLWSIIGATLLAGGFFLFGMYYGYQQGYEAARQSLSDGEPSRRASARSAPDSESSDSESQSAEPSGDERRSAAITADQLSGTEGVESSEQQAEDDSDSPRAGVYGTPSTTGTDQSRSTASEDTTTPDRENEGETTEEAEESSPTPGDRPQALSVTRLDTEEETTPQSAQETSTEPESTESTEESGSTTASGADDSDRSSGIEAEGPIFTIQAISFRKESRAEREVNELQSKGYEASITEKVINEQQYFRVRVGSFSDRTQADNAAQEMVEKGDIKDYWISRVEN